MPGRPWTEHEDALIEDAVRCSEAGRGDFELLARQLGRTLDAVRKRAQRIGVKVYRHHHRHGLYERR